MKEDLAMKASYGQVRMLRAGAERETPNGFYAPSTITFYQPRDLAGRAAGDACLIDAGAIGEANQTRALLTLDVGCPIKRTSEIKRVFITHNHPDHIGAIDLFDEAVCYMPDSIFKINKPNYYKMMSDNFLKTPGETLNLADIELPHLWLVSTPGHIGQDMTILFRDMGLDTIAIVGDLFWSQEDWEHDSEYLSLCANPELQKISRDYIREKLKPTVIVPGHGEAFAPRY